MGVTILIITTEWVSPAGIVIFCLSNVKYLKMNNLEKNTQRVG